MERGTILLNNLELEALQKMALAQGCEKQDLLNKLQPVANVLDALQEHSLEISEDDAEILLDCMPVPTEQTSPHLTSGRIKIQKFIAQCRFGEEG